MVDGHLSFDEPNLKICFVVENSTDLFSPLNSSTSITIICQRYRQFQTVP